MEGHPVFAAFYGWLARLAERGELGERRGQLISRAEGRVVEVGAGTGLNFQHYGPSVAEVIATEPDPHMLRRAGRAARDVNGPISLRRAPAEHLPLQDESADVVVSTLVLCTVPDQGAALKEARRVLRPGGRLLVLEHVRAADRRLARWQDRLEGPWGWFGAGCHPNRDTEAAIRSAGFDFEDLERFDLSRSLPLVRPHITGVARRPD